MALAFDQKEDLRLRMMELEKKLAESEEERCRLEKTCNVLMRAFREEEKMHYKALNKKYEKFLEDCTTRRRRNDIIMKSLCRIEDRARALFAKTERLKILKDRYISHLKISDFKKDEEPPLGWKNFRYSSTSQKIIHDVTPKSVHWKSPYVSDVMPEREAKQFNEPQGNSFYASTGESLYKTFRESKADFFEDIPTSHRTFEKLEDKLNYENVQHKPLSVYSFNAFDKGESLKVDYYKPEKTSTYFQNSVSLSSDKDNQPIGDQTTNFARNVIIPKTPKQEVSHVTIFDNEREEKDEILAKREKVALTHQESIEKLKKALSIEDDVTECDNFENAVESEKIIEKDAIEMNEKNLAQENTLKTVNDEFNRLGISAIDTTADLDSKNDAIDNQSDHSNDMAEPKNFPVGLDGVDYQNETYPESYYEQPVHHNHTSIASDVILEEDETEQDIDISEEGAKNTSIRNLESDESIGKDNQETGQISEPNLDKQMVNELTDKFKNQDEQTNETVLDEQSKKSDSLQNFEKGNKRPQQINLMNLLESDSESFQIEHGGMATGNEDSDFDFSFNQN